MASIFDKLDEDTKLNIKTKTLGLITGFAILYMRYRKLQREMIARTENEPEAWNNDYPIIFVHGYCGTTMDENWIIGG